jgi:hypothetical protein
VDECKPLAGGGAGGAANIRGDDNDEDVLGSFTTEVGTDG